MNEQQHDKTGAWALNALDAEERARVEEYLAEDPAAQDEARSFEETAALLAASLPPQTPRPALKNSVMAAISQTRQLPPLPGEEEDAPRPRTEDSPPAPAPAILPTPVAEEEEPSPAAPPAAVVPLDRYRASVRRSRWLSIAAAGLLVTTLVGVGLWTTERTQQERSEATIEALESAQATSQEERDMVSRMLASDDVSHTVAEADTGGSFSILYSPEAEGMIVRARGLDSLPGSSTYQLWMIPEGGDPVSAGVLADGEQTVMREGEVDPGMVFAVSVEPAGGSPQPTTTPIFQQEL